MRFKHFVEQKVEHYRNSQHQTYMLFLKIPEAFFVFVNTVWPLLVM